MKTDAVTKFMQAAEDAGVLVAVCAALSVFNEKCKGKEPRIGEWNQGIRDIVAQLEPEALDFLHRSVVRSMDTGIVLSVKTDSDGRVRVNRQAWHAARRNDDGMKSLFVDGEEHVFVPGCHDVDDCMRCSLVHKCPRYTGTCVKLCMVSGAHWEKAEDYAAKSSGVLMISIEELTATVNQLSIRLPGSSVDVVAITSLLPDRTFGIFSINPFVTGIRAGMRLLVSRKGKKDYKLVEVF